jgi:ATP-binding cassette subfamily C protein CydCD
MHLDKRLLRLAGENRLALALTVGLGFLAGLFTIAQAGALSQVVNRVFLEHQSLQQVSSLLLVLLAALLIRALLVWGGELAANRVAQGVKNALRGRLLKQILALGPAYTSGEQTGELTSALVERVDALEAYFSQYLPGLVLAALVPLTILLVVFPVDLLSGVVFLLTAPLIPLFMVLIGSLAQSLTQRQWQTLSRLSAYFLDVLQGLTTLKMLGSSQAQVEKIARLSDQFRQKTMDVLRVTFLSALVLEMVATLSTAIVAVEIGLRLLYGRLSFEQAFFVLLLAPEFYLPLRTLGARFHSGMSGVEAAQRIFQILDIPAREANPVQDGALPAPETAVHGNIRFQDVSVAFADERSALRGVTFEIRQGQRLALVGPSGSGKSTAAALLLRFIDPAQGEIWVDGQRLADIPVDIWRSNVAWVPQSPYLMNDTVEANIRLARPEASREQVIQAARQAEADEFIQALPQGYDTLVGERGMRLSGGEAQRLALARAFLKDASLVILDEATANLDLVSEARLQSGMKRLMAGRTVLVIAHRLNTVTQADRIVVLEQGRVVQSGTHAELSQQTGLYRNLLSALQARAWSGTVAQISPAGPLGLVETKFLESKIPEPEYLQTQFPEPERSSDTPLSEIDLLPVSATPRRLPVWLRLARLASAMKGWALLSILAGAATVLSGVGLMATSAYIISEAALQPSIAVLEVAIVGVRFFGIARGLFRYLERYLSHQATFRLLARLRTWFYQSLEPLAPARLLSYHSGDLLARILGDIQSLEDFYVRALAPPFTAILALSIVFIYISRFNLHLALALLIFWLAVGVGLPVLVRLLSLGAGDQLVRQRAGLSSAAVDFVQGLPDLQVYGQAEHSAMEIDQRGQALALVQRRLAGVNGLQIALTGGLSNLGMWSILYLAIPLVVTGQIQGVNLAVLSLAALTSFEAVASLPAAAQHLQSNFQSARRLFEVVDALPQVQDPLNPLPVPAQFDLRVRDLSFRYPGGDPALRGLSFDLLPGKRLAIVGPSGAGKSTLLNLLLRFWKFEDGQILWAGRDLREYAQNDIRRSIGVVPQRPYLFSASVRENLRLANPSASEQELIAAAERAQIHDFILSLPQGYDTWIGEQGVRLSAGERQRLAIARALLKDAPLLVLDEATANLDALTERKVLQAIYRWSAGRALLTITNRLAGMEWMDEILILDGGRVVERGKHAELLAAGGMYSRLWELQNLFLPEDPSLASQDG